MDENDPAHLDLEFKRYLQLLRPYLGQLDDVNVIQICDAWIKRLSDCNDKEKPLRNKYVFALCYQLAKGVLDCPFINRPPAELQPLSDEVISEDSSEELEYLVINSEEQQPNILFERMKMIGSDSECLSQPEESMNKYHDNVTYEGTSNDTGIDWSNYRQISNNTYPCPKIRSCKCSPDMEYEFRANNLVKKLREIKVQNALLQKELITLKEESHSKHDESVGESIPKVDNATSALLRANCSNMTLNSLKCQLQDVQDSRKSLIQMISQLQDKLDNFDELKKNEIDGIKAQQDIELIKLRTTIREETKGYYDKKLEELKVSYEEMVKKLHVKAENEYKQLSSEKDEIIDDKTKQLELKDAEISRLKAQLENQKSSLHSVLTKLIDKPKPTDDVTNENMKIRAQQLEKRLMKMEKSKIKTIKMFEAKLTQLQREKHLAECSLQLQLVRQRAQVVSELTEESQAELNSTLDKLESRYKNIVANVQATALQRRMQDQLALETIIQTACSMNSQSHSQFQPVVNNKNQSYDSEISTVMRGNKVGNVIAGNKSYGDDSLLGYCLNGERMGELFERVCIPQRDGVAK